MKRIIRVLAIVATMAALLLMAICPLAAAQARVPCEGRSYPIRWLRPLAYRRGVRARSAAKLGSVLRCLSELSTRLGATLYPARTAQWKYLSAGGVPYTTDSYSRTVQWNGSSAGGVQTMA